MAKLWNKYLVQRRDGSVPQWPWLVMGARDPAAPTAIRAYAKKAVEVGMDEEYITDLYKLADEWDKYRLENGEGDPDAPRHRQDNPEIIKALRGGGGTTQHRGDYN